MSAPQMSIFDQPRAPMLRDRFAAQPKPLRPYQQTAVGNVAAGWEGARSQLVVMPTGTGKTRLFSEIAKAWPGPVLVVAHRTELIDQGRRALEENCGEMVSTEKAEMRAGGTRIVVASVQTLKGERLENFARRHPATLVICDEAHHAVSPSYRTIFDAFGGAKLLGVTATPDRSDELAMGQVFDRVAFVYEIQDAIREKYLCPIRIKQVQVDEIDLSDVSTVAGDLNQGELDAVMKAEEVLHGIIAPSTRGDSLIQLAGDRPTASFWTSVDAAHRAAEIINRYKPDSARAVDGTTAADTRKALLRDFDAGRFQFICNVGVLTEGWDSPGVACVAMARPTKSRALYAQCVGRGLRPLPNKPDCLVLDFVGNSGKHRLMSALDILAGKYDNEVVEKARDILESQGMDGMMAEDVLESAQKLLDAKREREAASRIKLKARGAKRTVIDRDPFEALGVADPESDPKYAAYRAEATQPQRDALERAGIEAPANISKRQASALIEGLKVRREMGLCTIPQANKLAKRGVPNADKLTFTEAGRLMGHLGGEMAKRNWTFRFTPALLSQLIGQRDAGWEG